MRYFIPTVLAVVAVVSAQDISQLPSCAQTCFVGAIGSTSCGLTDLACLCRDNAFQSAVTQCVQSGCSAADQATTASFSSQSCASAGVSLSLPSATGSAASAVAASPTNTASSVRSSVASAASSASSHASSAASSAAPSASASNSPADRVAVGGALGVVAAAVAYFL